MGPPTNFDEGPTARSELEALAARTEERAANVRWYAATARDEAGRARAQGDHEAERLHLGEADMHERSARTIEQTAALYRRRIRRMTDDRTRPDGRTTRDGRTPPS